MVVLAVAACTPATGATGSSTPSAPGLGAEGARATPPVPAPTCGPDQDVPTFRGGPARSGLMAATAPTATPIVRWTLRTDRPLASSPVVVGGVAIQSTSGGTLYAVDVRTGTSRWTASLGGGLSTPTVVDAEVIVGSTHGSLTGLDVEDGTIRWSLDLGGQILGSPAPDPKAGSPDRSAVIVASTSGDAWRVRLDGTIDWTAHDLGRIDRSAAVARGIVVLPVAAGELVALDAPTGHLRWRTRVGTGEGVGSPALDGDVALSATGLDSGATGAHAVSALDLSTGSTRWVWADTKKAAYTPAIANGLAFAVSEDGEIVALDLMTGAERWRVAVDRPVEALAAVSGGLVVTASNDGAVLALDAETGSVIWQVPSHGVPFAPVVSCGLVLVPTDLGQLTAYGAP